LALTSYFERIGLRETLRSAASLCGPAIQAKKAAAIAAGVAYVEAPLSRPTPYQILELGAGTGYVGLWYALSHQSLQFTDSILVMSGLS
jgi:predicted O-methyltransferase YrrM